MLLRSTIRPLCVFGFLRKGFQELRNSFKSYSLAGCRSDAEKKSYLGDSMFANKIGIICGAGIVSGKEIMVLELTIGLREQGYIVDVVTSSWGSREFPRRCENMGVRTPLSVLA